MQNAKKVIYSLRVYLALEQEGFRPISTMPNPNKQELMCWVYDRTPELIEALNRILGG